METSKRIRYFDFLRGVAIIMVIAIHTYPNPDNYTNSFLTYLYVFFRSILNCAVPLFLTISGFFIAKKQFIDNSDKFKFWKSQIPSVYIPCLIFSLYWFANDCMSMNNGGGYLKAFIYYILCDYSIYYFIALIIECYLIAPYLHKHNNGITLITIVIINLLCTILFEYLKLHMGIHFPRIISGSILTLLMYFIIGFYLQKHSRDYSLCFPTVLIVLGLVCGLLHSYYLYNSKGVLLLGQKSSNFIYNTGVILLFFSSKMQNKFRDNTFSSFILFIGEISFGIYFTHILIIELFKYYFPEITSEWTIFCFFTLLITSVFVVAIKKLTPTMSRKLLGYR